MPDRKTRLPILWPTVLLVMLALVSFAPSRRSMAVCTPSRSADLAGGFDVSRSMPMAYIDAEMAAEAVTRVDALLSEGKEQNEAGALEEPRVALAVLSFSRDLPDRDWMVTCSAISLHPLRC